MLATRQTTGGNRKRKPGQFGFLGIVPMGAMLAPHLFNFFVVMVGCIYPAKKMPWNPRRNEH